MSGDESVDDASVIRDMAWRQIDLHGHGYIHGRDFDLLIDAIDSILNTTLLSEEGRSIVKEFTKTDGHRRITKSEFKPLFQTLVGVAFDKALASISYDKSLVDLERKAMSKNGNRRETADHIPHLSSTPDSSLIRKKVDSSISTSQLIDPPNFKKQFTKYKKLNDTKEDEIRYRDSVIENYEKEKPKLRKIEMKLTDLQRKNDSLEDEVIYRDKIILLKDQEIDEKDKQIKRIENENYKLRKEIQIYKSENRLHIKESQDKTRDFYNKELLQRIKLQQRAIDELKRALAENKDLIAMNPIKISSLSSSTSTTPSFQESSSIFPNYQFPIFSKDFPFNFRYLLITFLIASFFFMNPITHFKSIRKDSLKKIDPWYTGTILEPIFYSVFEDKDVDYDYYNLGDINIDSLREIH